MWDLSQKMDLTWQWVRGHNGHPENEHADQLARNAIAKKAWVSWLHRIVHMWSRGSPSGCKAGWAMAGKRVPKNLWRTKIYGKKCGARFFDFLCHGFNEHDGGLPNQSMFTMFLHAQMDEIIGLALLWKKYWGHCSGLAHRLVREIAKDCIPRTVFYRQKHVFPIKPGVCFVGVFGVKVSRAKN